MAEILDSSSSRQQVQDKVMEIVAKCLNISKEKQSTIVPEARFKEDLGGDSLDTVDFIMEVEEAFGIEVSDEEAQKITTVNDAVEYIEGTIKKND